VPGPAAPPGQPSAAAQALPTGQPGAERLSQAEAAGSHQNGHSPAGQAARRGSFSRS
jgi:hypothetical protein